MSLLGRSVARTMFVRMQFGVTSLGRETSRTILNSSVYNLQTLSRSQVCNQKPFLYFPVTKSFSTTSVSQYSPHSVEDALKTKKSKTNFRGRYVGLGLLGTLAVTLAVSEDFRNSVYGFVLTAERVGVVTVATIRCFRAYWKTLNLKDTLSPEDYQTQLSKCHKKAALITLKALETNGGVYIKLGQHVSAMTYLLPPEWTDTMIPLQHNCPESSLEEIQEMFKKDTGIELMEYFEELDPKPIGVASLAQVHTGILRNGHEKAAVKFQHPSLDKFVPLDIFLTRTVFNLMHKVFPEYSLTWLGDELQESIFVELDFRNEARNAQRTAEYFKNYSKLTSLVIPEIYDAKRRVLVMEYIGGARLDDLKYMDEHNISRGAVSSCLSHIFNNMIFTPGVGVHCDPHGGNLAIRAVDKSKSKSGMNFEIILYDHGLYRNIPNDMRINYARFWLALIDKDQEKMRYYGTKFAQISDEQFPILAAAITGRDFEHAMNDVTSVRKESEIENMTSQLLDNGLILDLMKLLSSIPRIVLLILKTNDLTRHLDESLKNPLGQERTFLIMATYCSRTTYADDVKRNDELNQKWSWKWICGEFTALARYYRRSMQLQLYDIALYFRNITKTADV